MKIKEMLSQILKSLSNSMITMAPASLGSVGIEEMPESMKNLR